MATRGIISLATLLERFVPAAFAGALPDGSGALDAEAADA
jgi:hypothetical protein